MNLFELAGTAASVLLAFLLPEPLATDGDQRNVLRFAAMIPETFGRFPRVLAVRSVSRP